MRCEGSLLSATVKISFWVVFSAQPLSIQLCVSPRGFGSKGNIVCSWLVAVGFIEVTAAPAAPSEVAGPSYTERPPACDMELRVSSC